MKKLILYLGILTILISSCDLKYTPPLTPLTKEKNRQDSIQNYLRTSFQKDSTTYESIAFSKSQMIKPISFK
ncbi:MAG: hypothetical protein KJ941_04095, partial [Bacteroidetes bacterium]|nr:hypothetical protein [Bacteroidota bacterium]